MTIELCAFMSDDADWYFSVGVAYLETGMMFMWPMAINPTP